MGEGRVAHAGRLGVAEEAVRAGSEEKRFLLQTGDSLAFGGEAAYSLRNGGTGPLALLAAGLLDPTQPALLYHENNGHHEH